jgi:hypothetical protein
MALVARDLDALEVAVDGHATIVYLHHQKAPNLVGLGAKRRIE